MKSVCLFSCSTWYVKGKKIAFGSAMFCLILFSSAVQAQQFRIPANKNPQFNNFLNPANNPDINPNFNPDRHPQFNSKMNMVFTPEINPVFNPSINPFFRSELNPLYNKELDPSYNFDLNPAFNLTGMVYNLNAEPAALLVDAWPGEVIIEYDLNGTWTGFWVSNSKGGFNFFDTASEFKGVSMWPNGQGGFNVFDDENVWLGFAW